MTKEEARIHLINWIEFATNSEKHPFMDEPCSDEEILEAMQIGADALCQPPLPSNLDEAAENSWAVYEYRESPRGLYSTCYLDGFKSGAEWMAEQGQTFEAHIDNGCAIASDVKLPFILWDTYEDGDVLKVQIRKKQ